MLWCFSRRSDPQTLIGCTKRGRGAPKDGSVQVMSVKGEVWLQDQQLGFVFLLLSASARQINAKISHLLAAQRKKERGAGEQMKERKMKEGEETFQKQREHPWNVSWKNNNN